MRFQELAAELAEVGFSICDMAEDQYDDPDVAARVHSLRQPLQDLRRLYR